MMTLERNWNAPWVQKQAKLIDIDNFKNKIT